MLSGRFALDGRPVPAALTGIRVSSPRAAVAFDGRLDNRAELAAICGLTAAGVDAAGDPETDAATVLAVYERFGDDFAAHLNGDFAIAVLDLTRTRLLLARDVMSARSLYYCDVPGAVLFASKISPLLADPEVTAAPDEDALAELVLDNWCDDERTCFRGIMSVPAGQLIIRSRDRIERRTHWAFDTGRSIRYRNADQYCEEFRFLFAQSVRRRLSGGTPVAVSLSGGVDSSSIFCQAAALAKTGKAPVDVRGVALVFPRDTEAGEAEFLDELEHAMPGVSIERIPASSYRYFDDADAVVRELECPAIAPHTQAALFGAAQRSGCRVVLSGYFADQMLADRGYLVDLVRAGRWLKVRHDLRELRTWLSNMEPGFLADDLRKRLIRSMSPAWALGAAKRVLAPWREASRYPAWFTPAFRARAVRRARERSAARPRFPSEHVTQYRRHLTAGHYNHAVRCERAIGEMHGVDVRYPYRDRDLVSFLMAIPGEVVNLNGASKGLLRRALTGILPDSIRLRRSKADFSGVENASLRRAHREMMTLVSPDCLSARAGFVDGRALVNAAPPADDDESAPGWRLTDAAGLEIWMRNFFPGYSGVA